MVWFSSDNFCFFCSNPCVALFVRFLFLLVCLLIYRFIFMRRDDERRKKQKAHKERDTMEFMREIGWVEGNKHQQPQSQQQQQQQVRSLHRVEGIPCMLKR